MDVRAENSGRPHQKMHFPAVPAVGRNFLTPGHPGVRVRKSAGNPDQKVYVCAVFSFLILTVFSFSQSLGAPKALQYKLEAYCTTNRRCMAILF